LNIEHCERPENQALSMFAPSMGPLVENSEFQGQVPYFDLAVPRESGTGALIRSDRSAKSEDKIEIRCLSLEFLSGALLKKTREKSSESWLNTFCT
jgi:hypothetical protein